LGDLELLIAKKSNPTSHIFIGGSQVKTNRMVVDFSLKEKKSIYLWCFQEIKISNKTD
jgi:hypothetical protein